MSQLSPAANHLPLLPFQNREAECARLLEFLRFSDASSSVLLLEGDAGLGKSTLLETVLNRIDSDPPAVRLNFDSRHLSLSEQISHTLHRSPSRRLARVLRLHPQQKLSSFVTSFLLKVLQGLPFGEALEFLSKRLFLSIGWQLPGEEENNLLRSDLLLSSLATHKNQIIAVDDLHTLTDDDLQLLADLVSKRFTNNDILTRFVFSSRPVESNLSPFFQRFLAGLKAISRLSILPLSPLSEASMKSLALHIIHNPSSSTALINIADGNPQRFFELLIRLNLRGKVTYINNQLVLGEGADGIQILGDEIWKTLRSDWLTERLLAVLAVGSGEVPETRLSALAQTLMVGPAELELAITRLRRQRILEWVSTSRLEDKFVLRFIHDTLRDQILHAISEGEQYDYRRYNQMAADYIFYSFKVAPFDLEQITKGLADLTLPPLSRLKPYIDDLAQLAINRQQAGAAGWQALALGILRIADSLGRHSTIIRIGEILLPSMQEMLNESALEIKYISRAMTKAYYQLGRYRDAYSIAINHANDGETLYYLAISHLIVKEWPNSLSVAQKSLRILASSRQEFDYLPLIKTVEALALQESGQARIAEREFSKFYSRSSRLKPRTLQWQQVKFMSALFLAAPTALTLCESAMRYFRRTGNDRGLGMAAHNAGWCYMRLKKYGAAGKKFKEARSCLGSKWPHEEVFPLNNLAAIALLEKRFSDARDLLTSCRFRRFEAFYEKAVLINLAYAHCGLGLPAAPRFLDQIREVPGLAVDDRSAWQVEYARFYILFRTRQEGLEQRDLDLCWSRLMTLKERHGVGLYWNSLMEQLGRRSVVTPRFLPLDGPNSLLGLDEICSPEISLIRPAGLCFGHI